MTDETTTNPVVMAGDRITGPGLYEARCGHIVQITHCNGGWWNSEWNGIRTEYDMNGRQRFDEGKEPNQWQLVRWVAPLPASEAEPETTTEQLAEIEGQGDTVQVREGRWRTRHGAVKNIRPCEPLRGAYFVWPWTDGVMTFQDNGRHQGSKESPNDLVEYLGPIEQQPEPQPVQGGLVRDVTHLLEESGVLDSAKAEQQIEELRSEVSYVQRLLGESRQRVTQLEELVGSLRTINVTQEKAFTAAGKENTALRNQLAAVKAELASVAADRQQLRVELDAAQQVPADSPELRQLRADLEQVTQERDQYLDSYQRIFGDLETIRETTKAATVEAIAEWLEPIRAVDNEHLANETLQHLPQIMRHLTGLDSPAID